MMVLGKMVEKILKVFNNFFGEIFAEMNKALCFSAITYAVLTTMYINF